MTELTYDYLVRHIVPGPRDAAYFGPFILLPLALMVPRSILYRWQSIALFMPLITICCIKAWRDMDGVDVISVNGLLWSAFLIALQDPWSDFRLVRQDKQLQAFEQGYPSARGERLAWIIKLLASIRLDNWKIGRPSHDRLQPPGAGFRSRRAFLLHALLSFVRGFVVLDLTRAYIETDPYFSDLGTTISSRLPFVELWWVPPQVFRSMVIGAQAWALIGQMFYLPAAIPVMLNRIGMISDNLSPHNWPSYFGPVSSIFKFGVRGFWGTFWHQTMRWTTTGPGYAMADLLNLSHRSLLRYAVLSISAFGLSGIVHMGLVPPEPLGTTVHVNTIRLCMAGFFWSQAVATSLEALVGRLFTYFTQPDRWTRGTGMTIRILVNSVWLVVWFSMCLPLLGEAARQLDYWHYWPLPVSLIRGLRGDGYVTWPVLLG